MVLIVGHDHAVNIEKEEVSQIFCDYVLLFTRKTKHATFLKRVI